MFKYYSQENRPILNYGPFYNVLKSHRNVEDYMFSFHALGSGSLRYLETNQEVAYAYETLLNLYSFWREKGYLSRKQIEFSIRLLNELGEI